MIGAASVGAFYHGFEPCTKTYNGLIELGGFLKTFKTGFDYFIENRAFEDVTLENKYDFALTSPPYYDTELYSSEETNSCVRYGTFDKWCAEFYIPMIDKVMACTNRFILNIGCRKYNLKRPIKYPVQEIKGRLSGIKGFGRMSKGKETFYLLKNI